MKKKDYYSTCAIPKPVDKKKTKKVNGYKDKPNRMCCICGRLAAERNEVFEGTGRRQNCVDEELFIDLCMVHHGAWHNPPTPEFEILKQAVRETKQKEWEEKYISSGHSPKEAREAFRTLFNKNYLDDEPEDEICPGK